MAKYNRGDIVLVPFPFIETGKEKRKLRPALIVSEMTISKRYTDINLIPISSRIHPDLFKTEILLDETSKFFSMTGLVKSSIAKCEMIITLPENFIVRKIGQLDNASLEKINNALKLVLGLK